jgi:hypothetical protein
LNAPGSSDSRSPSTGGGWRERKRRAETTQWKVLQAAEKAAWQATCREEEDGPRQEERGARCIGKKTKRTGTLV